MQAEATGGAEVEADDVGSGAHDETDEADAVTTDGDGSADAPRGRWSRPRLRWWLLLAAVLWVCFAGWSLVRAKAESQEGVDRLRALRDTLTPVGLIKGEGADELAEARDLFASAHGRVDSPLLLPMRILPVVSRQLASIRALTGSAATVTDAGLDAVAEFQTALDGDQTSGPARVVLTERIGAIADHARARVESTDLGPDEALVGALASGRERFAEERARMLDGLGAVNVGARGLHEFLAGPSNYLLLAANNGEMRSGSGMLLSAGLLTVSDGRLDVGDMQSTTELRLPPLVVPVQGDMADLWGWTQPGEEWRNLGMTARFDATAALAADMWQARTGRRPDGVLVLDPPALQAILAATGPVEVDGQQITADNVVEELLVEQYRGITAGDWRQRGSQTEQRRERLSDIAQAALQALEQGGWDIPTLLDGLSGAVRGRHVLLWSDKPLQQDGWRAAGASGELAADSLLLSVLSQGGTKLDPFLDVDATIERRASAPGVDEVAVTARIENRSPTDLPFYVAGPSNGGDDTSPVGVPEGVYAGILTLNAPGTAGDLHIEGNDDPLIGGRDGPTIVIGQRIRLARGEATTVTFRLRIPTSAPIDVEASARVQATHWRAGSEEWWDTDRHELRP